jgi:uncharacterized sulfatase
MPKPTPTRASAIARRHFLSLAAGAPAAAAQSGRKRRPNIVMLFADDMGYSDLSCYGNPAIRTPNLDSMAAQGMRMTSFYAAASVCTPSRTGLLTGRYPLRAGLPNNLGPDSRGGLPLSEKLIPELLKPLGYRTMAIGKWHLGHDPAAQLPVSRGFDSYFGLLYSNDMIPPFVQTNRPLELYRDSKPVERLGDQSDLTQRYTEEALKFIRASRSDPFFLYLPYSMPHLPVSARPPFAGRSRAGIYGDVIETIDWSAGQILGELKKLGLDNDTMVVFASDNGPWHDLPQRMYANGVEAWHTGSKGMLRGAKGSTWEGGFRVPGIARWPGVIPAGQTSADMASTIDLLPTFAAAAGAALPGDRKYDGSDLLPWLTGSAPAPRQDFFYYLGAKLHAVREGPWKLRAPEKEPPALFHLDRDPAEMYDVRARHPEVADRLATRMQRMNAELPPA